MNPYFPISVELLDDGRFHLEWTDAFTSQPVEIYVADKPDVSVASTRVASSAVREAFIDGLATDVRPYFWLQPVDGVGGMTAAQRDVPLEAGTNFRDMGGYLAANGRRVRWGKLFRSGHSAYLTEQDQQLVRSLDIGVCCDFRRLDEQSTEISRLCPTTRIVPVSIDPGSSSSFFDQLKEQGGQPEEMAAFMVDINREFVRVHDAPYRRLFRELLNLDERAFMFNCAAGKDRTGFGAALILAALGVSDETILSDYLLTKRYYPWEREIGRLKAKYFESAGANVNTALLMPMLEVRPEYLRAALGVIQDDYGSMNAYLEDALGIGPIERAELQERLTA